MTYFITFTTYGSHLHGEDRGAVDRNHNQIGAPLLEARPGLLNYERRGLHHPPYLLDAARRAIVLEAIRSVSQYREWSLLAVHVRTNHVHVVIEAGCDPEGIAQNFKQHSSRALNESGLDCTGRTRWARGSSIRRLADRDARERAIRYVAIHQGEPMALFVAAERTP